MVTSTASGKTLCYNVPVLNALLEDPSARALYVFPTKALAQDQLGTLQRLIAAAPNLAHVKVSTYDGDKICLIELPDVKRQRDVKKGEKE